jgi:hypothetical protein
MERCQRQASERGGAPMVTVTYCRVLLAIPAPRANNPCVRFCDGMCCRKNHGLPVVSLARRLWPRHHPHNTRIKSCGADPARRNRSNRTHPANVSTAIFPSLSRRCFAHAKHAQRRIARSRRRRGIHMAQKLVRAPAMLPRLPAAWMHQAFAAWLAPAAQTGRTPGLLCGNCAITAGSMLNV